VINIVVEEEESHAVESPAVENHAVESHAVENHAVESHAVENHAEKSPYKLFWCNDGNNFKIDPNKKGKKRRKSRKKR